MHTHLKPPHSHIRGSHIFAYHTLTAHLKRRETTRQKMGVANLLKDLQAACNIAGVKLTQDQVRHIRRDANINNVDLPMIAHAVIRRPGDEVEQLSTLIQRMCSAVFFCTNFDRSQFEGEEYDDWWRTIPSEREETFVELKATLKTGSIVEIIRSFVRDHSEELERGMPHDVIMAVIDDYYQKNKAKAETEAERAESRTPFILKENQLNAHMTPEEEDGLLASRKSKRRFYERANEHFMYGIHPLSARLHSVAMRGNGNGNDITGDAVKLIGLGPEFTIAAGEENEVDVTEVLDIGDAVTLVNKEDIGEGSAYSITANAYLPVWNDADSLDKAKDPMLWIEVNLTDGWGKVETVSARIPASLRSAAQWPCVHIPVQHKHIDELGDKDDMLPCFELVLTLQSIDIETNEDLVIVEGERTELKKARFNFSSAVYFTRPVPHHIRTSLEGDTHALSIAARCAAYGFPTIIQTFYDADWFLLNLFLQEAFVCFAEQMGLSNATRIILHVAPRRRDTPHTYYDLHTLYRQHRAVFDNCVRMQLYIAYAGNDFSNGLGKVGYVGGNRAIAAFQKAMPVCVDRAKPWKLVYNTESLESFARMSSGNKAVICNGPKVKKGEQRNEITMKEWTKQYFYIFKQLELCLAGFKDVIEQPA